MNFHQRLEEEWRLVEGSNHMVSSLGRVYSLPRRASVGSGHSRSVSGRVLSLNTSGSGYKRVTMTHEDGPKLVHRLVAQAFIPNPLGLATINHKNGNKIDNRVENLEWCSNRDNVLHAWEMGLCDNRRKILCIDTGKVYASLKDASESYGLSRGNLCSTLKGKQKKWGGHRWVYADQPLAKKISQMGVQCPPMGRE